MSRTILHVDLDAFFCSVEEQLSPELKGRAFVVGGSAEGRGVVSSASYPARKYGIHSAMPTAQAIRLCRGLIVVPPRHGVYGEHSRQVMGLLRQSAPVMEQLSIDEAFLDATGDPLPGHELARKLQSEILERFGLSTSWGVASNKLVAKIATEVGKPRGIIVVPAGDEAAFLAPLPVQMLWGVGPKMRQSLAGLGIQTIGELAAMEEKRLIALFGERGRELATRSLGQDDRPLAEEREARSMSAETTFSRDMSEAKELKSTLRKLSERVGARLRRAGLAGRTVRLKLRWPDFRTITRQTRVDQAVDQDGEIYRTALSLLERVWRRGRSVRLIGVGVSDLGSPARQLHLFDRSWERDNELAKALDAIRTKYGPNAVRRASSMRSGSHPGKIDQGDWDTDEEDPS
ncbi:MAG: DNA polymerase IV [Anaerolineales bacterium]|jgi:DNA polymerase-4